MTSSQSILVLGAGELGLAVLRGLTDRFPPSKENSINLLLRPSTISSLSSDKQAEISLIRDLGIKIIPGDLANASESELAGIFKEFRTVISCTGYGGGRGTQLKIARAVLEAGIELYIPWQFGVDYDTIGRGSAQDLFDEQLDVRDLLRNGQNTRTNWVIISTGMFTSFLFEPSTGIVDFEGGRVRAWGSWETKVTVTTPEDIGILTAEVIADGIKNQVVFIGGDTVTYGQVADVVEELAGRKFERTVLDLDTLRRELEQEPENGLKKYRIVFGEGKGVSWDKEKTYNVAKGISTVGMREWAKKNF